ncbi:hypothetical protein HK102_013715 [Quaeritorhiza haematococci]|nr:hypothetical protein HK102_013715 [Quaeritorhiza haematococci]
MRPTEEELSGYEYWYQEADGGSGDTDRGSGENVGVSGRLGARKEDVMLSLKASTAAPRPKPPLSTTPKANGVGGQSGQTVGLGGLVAYGSDEDD